MRAAKSSICSNLLALRSLPRTIQPYRFLSLSKPNYSTRSAAQRKISQIDLQQPFVSPNLIDSFGRQHDYLRISLTEKCNLRCTYCMPSTGVPLLPQDDLLTTDEIERVAKLFISNGVKKIRLTGGEPTVRKDLIDVVSRISALKPKLESLGMTSNGVTLRRHLPSLVKAGLTHLNLSLDTLDEFKYELMTRRRGFHKVMESLEVAKGLRKDGLRVKINVVVIKGLNDMEVSDFVELTKNEDITVRFIEYMPFEDNRWSTTKLVPSSTLLSQIETHYDSSRSIEKLSDSPSDTTRAFRVSGYRGSFGFISSMTDHFCGSCSRLRVGADGGVKVCLFGPPALSLRPLLRSLPSTPQNDSTISEKIGEIVWKKKFAHDGLGGRSIPLNRARKPDETQSSIMLGTASHRPTLRKPRKYQAPILGTLPSLAFSSTSSFESLRLFSTTPLARTPTKPPPQSPILSHIDPATGKASMVDVSQKAVTLRTATAKGKIYLNRTAFSMIDFGDSSSSAGTATMKTKKGDVLSIAQLAGIMGVKQTSSLIPLCHPLSLSHVSVTLVPSEADSSIEITCTATCRGMTGVEMEALMGVSIAGLTIWDMCKAVAGEEMTLGDIRVVEKRGGRSGDWKRGE